MALDLDEITFSELLCEKFPHTHANQVALELDQEVNELATKQGAALKKVQEGVLKALKNDNPNEFNKLEIKRITTGNITDFFQHRLNELLSYSEYQLKNYFSKQNSSVKNGVLHFAAKLINIIDIKTIQKFAESNIEIREALHNTYQNIEDALEPNCITRVGDLLGDKQVRASILMNAAKESKKQGVKFDPSPYIPNYESYNRKSHGEPIPYLKKYFGEFLASCNEEEIDYLYRGDIPVIDSVLRGTLYRDYRDEFEKLTCIAGRKSKKEIFKMTAKGREKLNKIISLDMSSKK